MDSITIRYQLTPKITDPSFPLNAKIAYDLGVPVGDTYVMTSHAFDLEDIEACENLESGYSPAYSIFNVELDSLNADDANGEDNSLVNAAIEKGLKAFEESMDDDLNISGGLAAVFEFMTSINKMRLE